MQHKLAVVIQIAVVERTTICCNRLRCGYPLFPNHNLALVNQLTALIIERRRLFRAQPTQATLLTQQPPAEI